MENKHTIYLNMCYHYRKILSAKPCVDTSPPKVFPLKTNNSCKYNRGTSSIHQQIAKSDRKKQYQNQDSILKQNNGPVICQYYYQHHLKEMDSSILNKSFIVSKKPFCSTILKSEAQSKFKNLRVYHPPRKKKVVLKVSESSQSSRVKRADQKEEIIRSRIFDRTEVKNTKISFSTIDNSYSEESSEDSAYNEEECVMSSDSGGSTPQNSTNTNQPMKKLLTTLGRKTKSAKLSNTPSSNNVAQDIACIQFLKDITNDILKKNIFTNKALRSVFEHHFQINKYELNTEKMLNEIFKLQERLGVPKDNKFDDEDYGLGKDIFDEEAENVKDVRNDEDEVSSPSNVLNDETNTENKSDENSEGDIFDENYSDDSFGEDDSYTSSSERLKSGDGQEDSSTDNDEIASVSNDEISEDRVSEINSDNAKNYEKMASNSESDTDAEISEVC